MDQSVGDETSVDIKALEKTIRDNLGVGSLLSVTSCIFRVPEVLRRNNTKAYHPDVVAIGPLHDRKQTQYQHMEKVKRWYLREYILASKNVDLTELIKVITRNEKLIRDCYAESLDSIESNEFREMMILDGCFIVELFRKFRYKILKRTDGSEPKEDDPILSQPMENDPILNMDCMFQYICHDLLLLENQLPWVVLQCLYSLTRGNLEPSRSELPLSELILHVFTFLPSLGNTCKAYLHDICLGSDNNVNHKHVLDLVRTSIVYKFEAPVPSHDGETRCLQRAKRDKTETGNEIPPATTLSRGGVKFERGFHDGKSIMSMGFKGGVLRIPQLEIAELTEPLFRNLIAFEQCYQGHSHKITSYAAIMDKLISSEEDMEFLCKKKIIRNWLSAKSGFEFFDKLYNDTLLNEFYYKELCIGVNGYYNIKCVRWTEYFKRVYFRNPWTIISLFAAIILLVLTLLQTIFTVHG